MDDSWVCYDELGVWCNFNILWLDSWPCSPIFGEMGKLCQILSKIWWCLHLAPCHKQMAQHIETGKYSFVWGIIALHFGENYASLLLPISEEAWQTCTSFVKKHHPLYCRSQMAPRPNSHTAAMENDVIFSADLLRCICCLQCFDTVGWTAGRASGL